MKNCAQHLWQLGPLFALVGLIAVGCGPGDINAAARAGNIEKAREILASGADPNQRGENGNTPLHFATWEGHLDVVKVLLENGARVNVTNRDGPHTPLHVAATFGREAIARSLLDAGADVNARDGNGLTPLHFAAGKGHADVARLLVEHGADLAAESNDTRDTPLDTAKRMGNQIVVQVLQAGGDSKSAKSESTKAKPTSPPQLISVGVFTFEVPSEWQIVSGSEERSAKKEVAASVRQMIESFQNNSGSGQGLLGIQEFRAIKLPDGAGWFIAYTIRMPPQRDYLATMELDQKQKISWGKKQGVVTRVNEHVRTSIGDADIIKMDTQMRGGARNLGIYYWSPSEPGLVATISVVVNPGNYNNIQSSLDGVFSSLQIK